MVQITNQYWIVGDTNPTTQVWSGPTGAMVANTNATFETWLNAADGRADVMNGGSVVSTANNGAGAIRVQVTGGVFSTGQVFNFVGNNSGAAGAAAITAIDSTHFDIVGSTFSVADTGGTIWSATVIDTAANLYQSINTYNVTLWQAARFLGTNSLTGTGANLTNPMLDVQNCNFSGSGSTRVVILPQMNVPGSIPIGMPVFILNNSQAVPDHASVQVRAFDGVTQIGQTIPFGLAMVLTLAANDTTNGTFTPGLRTLTNDTLALWNVPRGGTGVQTLANHGILIGQGNSPLNVTAAMTDGQLLVGQTGADPAPETVSGDATLAASGALTLASTITAGGPTGDATHVPQITYDAKGRLTAVSSILITGTTPGGAAGGDLTGTYPNPTIAKIQGTTVSGTVGTGNVVFSSAPTITTPALTNVGAPSSPSAGFIFLYGDSTQKIFTSKNESGTVSNTVIPDTGSSHNFITGISAAGVITKAQPASTDISGLGTAATQNTGTSGANLPFLNGTNTWSGTNTYSAPIATTQAMGTANVDGSGIAGVTINSGSNHAIEGAGSFLFFVTDLTQGRAALYMGDSPNATAYLVNGGSGLWVAPTTTPGAGSCSVQWDGASNFKIYSNRGGGINDSFAVFAIKMAI